MDAPGKAVPRWEHFAHEADMGVRGLGASLGQAFEQGALAMTALVTEHRAAIRRWLRTA